MASPLRSPLAVKSSNCVQDEVASEKDAKMAEPCEDETESQAAVSVSECFKRPRLARRGHSLTTPSKSDEIEDNGENKGKARRGQSLATNVKKGIAQKAIVELKKVQAEEVKPVPVLPEPRKIFRLQATNRRKFIEKDLDIDNFVFANDSKPAKYWDAKFLNRQGKPTTDQFQANYVVGCTARTLGDTQMPENFLISYYNYARPNWVPYTLNVDLPLLKDYMIREQQLDKVEAVARKDYSDFDAKFPNRYMEYELGEGAGGYITKPLSIYKNRLRAIEWRWNYINRSYGFEDLMVEDWTAEPADDQALKDLYYTMEMWQTLGVQRLVEKFPKAQALCCGPECKSCNYNMTSTVALKCCGLKRMMEKDKETEVLRFRETTGDVADSDVIYECTAECGCDPKKCRNRGVEKGRQVQVVVFRVPGKGWTIRAAEEIPSRTVTGYYTGVMARSSSRGAASTHDFELGVRMMIGPREGLGGKKRVLPVFHIRAFERGNETRFISHSCSPNMSVTQSIVDRYGAHYAYPVFRTNRLIKSGEELTFDYFSAAPHLSVRYMFDACACGTPKCRYTLEKMAEMVERERAAAEEKERRRREAMENGEDLSEGDEEMYNEDDDDDTLVPLIEPVAPPEEAAAADPTAAVVAAPAAAAAGDKPKPPPKKRGRKRKVKTEEDKDEVEPAKRENALG